MTTHTVQDLATETLRFLGKLEAQEEAAAEDYAHIARVYRGKLAEWQMEDVGLAYWIEEEIPDEAFHYVYRLIAQDVASAYGTVPPTEMDDNGQMITCGLKGLRGLKRIMARAPSGLPVTTFASFM